MTDFKEYLRTHGASDETCRGKSADHEKVAHGVAIEWLRLKQRVHNLAESETYDGESFAWAPYPAPCSDFLVVKDVSTSFHDFEGKESLPSSYMIRFGRKFLPPKQNKIDSLLKYLPHHLASRIPGQERAQNEFPAEFWHLNPTWNDGWFEWNVIELKKCIPTEDLADEILVRFIEYYKDYEAAASYRR